MSKPPAPSANVKTALRVIEIIETFARERRALSLSELARLLAVPASSCLALIRTLTSLGYLYETSRRQGYYPTGRLLAMAQQIARHDPVLDRVHDTMAELREATGETIVIGKLHEGRAVLYLDVLESPHAIRYIATAGEARELHANSIGKALLAAMDDDERAALLKQLPLERFTARTLTTRKDIEAELVASKARGAFVNLSESMPDVGALAWPVRLSGECYAISIAGPVYRIEPNIERFSAILRTACATLERVN
ncbi:IclR family transcriptional regulator [Cupriavidus plantarum]|uniref:IclR family transcriptional regulator n=1 Tax=Cupriavidus plantarum TaxID=942865 RepID=A0A316EUF0_9BURK|nr:IclR family transcriptional regulator [Cupriavidus plantarum]NYI00803.1 DNA-binding IclR family transcriptional regulator [Cupriavidus plantarum]PWK35215.1 IclR family transcriptional regulator [Cupriavidus plantarum]REE93660.1 IclR family transcriptional regulator [Cupriavidus plantarum]RLK39081.1 IclR family transcriptional regulator [Cupriavidus plantarum]CAG2135506.1 Pectin degradation repressor protein KdgR [Cupriavidus plantarum]